MASTFGTAHNPAHFVEIPDPDYVDPNPDGALGPATQTRRPPAGFVLKVVDATSGAQLPDIVTKDYGEWEYILADGIPAIFVSRDGGMTYDRGPLWSKEADDAAHIPDTGGGGGGGGTGTVTAVAGVTPDATGNVPLTAQSIGARAAGDPILASQVSGLQPVATSGNYNDLAGLPVVRDIEQNLDGSWPNRPSTTRRCTWLSLPGNTTPPATSGSTSGGPGMVPGFDYYIQNPA